MVVDALSLFVSELSEPLAPFLRALLLLFRREIARIIFLALAAFAPELVGDLLKLGLGW